MKKQVVVIHGGDTFESYKEYISFLRDFVIDAIDFFKGKGWKDFLQEDLGDAYEVLTPKMPNKSNAKYEEWKIWFEKLVPFLRDNVILVGHSLGGIFIAKYLSENTFPVHTRATFLVAAPYDAVDTDYTLADFGLPASLATFSTQGGAIYIYHSKDDSIVPFVDLVKYKKQVPNAHCFELENRGHFGQEHFPELVAEIKKLN